MAKVKVYAVLFMPVGRYGKKAYFPCDLAQSPISLKGQYAEVAKWQTHQL